MTSGAFIGGHHIVMDVFYCAGFVLPFHLQVHLTPEQAEGLGEKFPTLPPAAAEPQHPHQRPSDHRGRLSPQHPAMPAPRRDDPHPGRSGLHLLGWATDRDARLPSIGRVKVVFSRRKKFEKAPPIVTNDRTLSRQQIIQTYAIRFLIERFLFKDAKRGLELGEDQTTKLPGAVTHLRLVMPAYSLRVERAVDARERERQSRTRRTKRGKRNAALGVWSLMDLRDAVRDLDLVLEDLLDYLLESDPKQAIRHLREPMTAA